MSSSSDRENNPRHPDTQVATSEFGKVQEMTDEVKPTVVLVHGVWCDGSVWREVITLLAHQGIRASAAQIPLTSFDEDVADVHRMLDHQEGPVVLVGHSYGGGVISAAGNRPSVQKLVYITAFAPQPGEVFGAIMGKNPPAAQIEMKPDAHGFIWATSPQFQDAIAHDIHRGLVHLAVAVQKPFATKIFEASIANPAWQSKPSWYLVTTEDRILNPITQREMAKQVGATVKEIATSHMPLLANPQAVADIIAEAAQL
jgi:pimeloyl-ACP methyl ester carboxylesterase